MITLLNQTIDSLYLRLFSLSEASAWYIEQAPLWREFKQNFDYSNPKSYFVDFPALGRFQLLNVGHRPFEFVFTNSEIGDIRIFNPQKFLGKAAIATGQIYLDFRSKWLQCQSDDYGLVDIFLNNCISLFFNADLASWTKVSRADLAVDTTGYKFDWSDFKLLCTRARKKEGFTTSCTVADLQAVYEVLNPSPPPKCNKGVSNDTSPESQNKEITLTPSQLSILRDLVSQAIEDPSLSRAIFQKDLQTAYIGRFGSKLYARIYVKSDEIKISGKDYLKAYWQEKGWQEEDPVTRVEFSLSGDFLSEFWASEENSQHWAHFRDSIDQIWTYLTSDWLRHTTGENTLNSRSPNTEFWDCVCSAFSPNTIFARIPIPALPEESLAIQLINQAKGCLKSAAALLIGGWHKAFGFSKGEQFDYLPNLIDAIGLELHQIPFKEIQERRDHYGCDDFSDTAFSASLRQHRIKLGGGS